MSSLDLQAIMSKYNFYEKFIPKEMLFALLSDRTKNIEDVQVGTSIKKEMTIFFSDIRSFSTISEKLPPEKIFKYLSMYLRNIAPIIREHNGVIDKYIGDAVLALFPLTAEDAIRASMQIAKKLAHLNKRLKKINYPEIHIGIGVHTGDVMLGMLGEGKRVEVTVISDAVNLASRLENLNKLYGSTVIISKSVLERMRDQAFNTRILDQIQVKGKLEKTLVFESFDADSPEQITLKQKTKGLFENGITYFHKGEFKEASDCFLSVIRENPNDRIAVFCLYRTAHFIATGYSLVEQVSEKLFVWGPEYEIGIRGIDEQHKKLVDIINDLHWAQQNKSNRNLIRDVLHRLVIYTLAHFSVEEELMLRFKTQDYENHKNQHLKFTVKVGEFIEDYKSGKADLTLEVLEFLKNWLIKHTRGSDRLMATYIKMGEEEIPF